MGTKRGQVSPEESGKEAEKGYPTPYEPLPFEINVNGTVNGEEVEITGSGVVPTIGVYEATLNFSSIPDGFHPSAVSISNVSICCANLAAARNDANNIAEMGTRGYATHREVSLPGEYDGEVVIEGDVFTGESGFGFNGEIEGEMRLPDDIGGNSMYFQRFVPSEEGQVLTGTAYGSLFESPNEEVKLRLDEEHELVDSPSNPLTEPMFRVVTESGTLQGRTYHTVVHSILDTENTLQTIVDETEQ